MNITSNPSQETIERLKQSLQEKKDSIERLEYSLSIKYLAKEYPYVIFEENLFHFIYNIEVKEVKQGTLCNIGITFNPQEISLYDKITAKEICSHFNINYPDKKYSFCTEKDFQHLLLERDRNDVETIEKLLNSFERV